MHLGPASRAQDIGISGRWIPCPDGPLSTSWAGSSISFIFFGESLSIISGRSTERKDRFNGGSPMIALSVGPDEMSIIENQSLTTVCDLEAGDCFTLVHNEAGVMERLYVRIILVDWATSFELEALVMDEVRCLYGLFFKLDSNKTQNNNPECDNSITTQCRIQLYYVRRRFDIMWVLYPIRGCFTPRSIVQRLLGCIPLRRTAAVGSIYISANHRC
jgi:hypothetical protein